jgi:hypothetical protein
MAGSLSGKFNGIVSPFVCIQTAKLRKIFHKKKKKEEKESLEFRV